MDTLRKFVNGSFEESFNIIFMENIKNYKKNQLLFFPIKSF